MDFYIRYFYGEADEGLGANDRSTDGGLGIQNPFGTYSIIGVGFNLINPGANSVVYTISNGNYSTNTSFPQIPIHHSVTSGDYIRRYTTPGTPPAAPFSAFYSSPKFEESAGGFLKGWWYSKGWTTGTLATFEEELCDFFYTITQEQPANIGTFGTIPSTMNLYLFELYLRDSEEILFIPFFIKGNDPARDRIYTASLIP